jgi:hypothetical protein
MLLGNFAYERLNAIFGAARHQLRIESARHASPRHRETISRHHHFGVGAFALVKISAVKQRYKAPMSFLSRFRILPKTLAVIGYIGINSLKELDAKAGQMNSAADRALLAARG